MDIMKLATQMLSSKLGGSEGGNSADSIQSALGSLLGSGSQDIDLGSIVGKLQSSGLSDIAESWLGDGANSSISTSQIESMLGSDKIQQAASQLGADPSSLLEGLKDMIPQVVDKSSSGGSLLDSIGGVSGLAGMAGKLFK